MTLSILGLIAIWLNLSNYEFVKLIIRLTRGGLLSSQTVGSLLRTPWLAKPIRKMMWVYLKYWIWLTNNLTNSDITLIATLRINDTQHNVMLNAALFCYYECKSTKCHFTDSRGATMFAASAKKLNLEKWQIMEAPTIFYPPPGPPAPHVPGWAHAQNTKVPSVQLT
jgi:hypothetical protein